MGERHCRYCEKSFQPSKYQPQQAGYRELDCQKQRRTEYRQQKLEGRPGVPPGVPRQLAEMAQPKPRLLAAVIAKSTPIPSPKIGRSAGARPQATPARSPKEQCRERQEYQFVGLPRPTLFTLQPDCRFIAVAAPEDLPVSPDPDTESSTDRRRIAANGSTGATLVQHAGIVCTRPSASK
jgi:hypothetical protein